MVKREKHYTALIGLVASIVCRLGFGSSAFMVPTMLCILVCLTAFKKPIEKAGGLV